MNKVLFSSNSDEWETPDDVFQELDLEFHFNLDPCATEQNHKCSEYYTLNNSGLEKSWGGTEYSAIHHIAKSQPGLRSVITKV